MAASPGDPSPPVAGRFWTLDALRGACALTVFLNHWYLWSNFVPVGLTERFIKQLASDLYGTFIALSWPTGGHHPAVICFFVLSGFCIHYPHALRARAGETPRWKAYYQRRAKRIFPVFWCGGLLGLAFALAHFLRPSADPLLYLHAATTLPDVFVRLGGLEGLYPHEVIAGNYILVTVATELIMYALYPAIHASARRWGWLAPGIFWAAMHVGAVGLLQLDVSPVWVFNSVFIFGIFWFAGAFAAERFVAGRAQVHPLVVAAAWALFLGVKELPHFYGLNLIKQVLWATVCLTGLLCLLGREHARAAWRGTWPVRGLCAVGRASYSLYAVHTPAIVLTSWWLLVIVGAPHYRLQLAATMLVSVGLTLAVYYGVERRSLGSRSPV